MRVLSPNVRALMDQPNFLTYYLFQIKSETFNIAFTTYFGDMTIPGLGFFTAEHNITDFKPPIMERASNREAYKMTFAGGGLNLRALGEANLLGARATLYMGLINTLDYPIGGADPGQPLLGLEDIVKGFDGVIDSKDYAVNPFENVNLFNIECSTPMAGLGVKRTYDTSKEYVRQLNGEDTSYDYIYEGSSSVSLLWGKE